MTEVSVFALTFATHTLFRSNLYIIVGTCQQHVSYLMAEASYKRRVIGDLAWAMGVVPVKRAQDYAKVGTGKITMTVTGGDGAAEIQVAGTDTAFTKELSKGDKIRPAGNAIAFKVASIENDTSLIVELGDAPADCAYPKDAPVAFDVMQHTDTKLVFAKVIDRLADGGAVGIFPEGGSHDRTDLLPLKVGVALIAYSALEENGINVPIVPVGLNYFRAHRWRGRAVVEYGQPINIDPSTLGAFKAGGGQKREVCNKLLENIESSMRSVIVAAPGESGLVDYTVPSCLFLLLVSHPLTTAQTTRHSRLFTLPVGSICGID
jgi:glycerol-3-phosphate O-acyltransferase/dihydroxyacetone phosphate acyltransferase